MNPFGLSIRLIDAIDRIARQQIARGIGQPIEHIPDTTRNQARPSPHTPPEGIPRPLHPGRHRPGRTVWDRYRNRKATR